MRAKVRPGYVFFRVARFRNHDGTIEREEIAERVEGPAEIELSETEFREQAAKLEPISTEKAQETSEAPREDALLTSSGSDPSPTNGSASEATPARLTCAHCRASFVAEHDSARYCSSECDADSHRERVASHATNVGTPNIIDALSDPAFLGSTFGNSGTWRSWITFLRSVYGLPLAFAELEAFRAHTGRHAPRAEGYPEAVCIVGRQSGKTKIASIAGVFEAARAVLEGQRGVYVPLVAQDLRGAQRALFGYVSEAIDGSELLSREVVRRTATEIELAGRVTIGVYPCRPAAVRGIRATHAVVDELAFFLATDGRRTDTEMLRAVRPALATTGGRLLILSSPYAQAGALWELHRKHFGRDDSSTLTWRASAPEMNPTLPADYLARMERDDPEAYRSEVLGEFRAGISTLFDPDAVSACVEEGVRERAPVTGVQYVGFVDPASGSGKDAFTAAIAHLDGECAVLDALRTWRPPFNPSGVIAEASDLLRRYGLREVTGDRYAPGFVEEGFRSHGIIYTPSTRNRSEIYLEMLPAINAGRVVLLDDNEMMQELRALERRRGSSGKDRIDHAPGQHDDDANATAGALVLALGQPGSPGFFRPRPKAGGWVRVS